MSITLPLEYDDELRKGTRRTIEAFTFECERLLEPITDERTRKRFEDHLHRARPRIHEEACARVRAILAARGVKRTRSCPREPLVSIAADESIHNSTPHTGALTAKHNGSHDVVTVDTEFSKTENGRIHPTQHNIRLAIVKLGVHLSHDLFADASLLDDLQFDDPALVALRLRIDQEFKFLPPKDLFFDVVGNEARSRSFHPVRDYLSAVEWDGVHRVDRWLIDYAGAVDSEYVRAVSVLPLIAAVRRVRRPGTKFDEVLVLEGDQGTNKSQALRILAVRDEWFTDDLPLGAESKVAIEQLAGHWIVEAGELHGLKKADIDKLKAFCSRQVLIPS